MSDKDIGVRLTADDQISPKVKNIKQELRQIQAELPGIVAKFGQFSAEAAAVAQRAAQLNDQIQDSRSLIDAFNPDTKFKAFGASIQTVVGGFTALTGAMGLLGVESEEVQKTLLKVQSALAISQGVAQLQEGIQSFKNLGSVILNTLGKNGLIGIGIAGVAAIGLALSGVFDSVSLKVKTLKDSMKELEKATSGATKEVYEVRNAFKQAEAGIITNKKALDTYNDGIGKTIGFAKDLNEAEKLTAENAAAYIKVQGLKAQANYILGKSAEIAANAMIAEQKAGEWKNAPAFIRNQFQVALDKQKKDAADLLLLVDDINVKIGQASAGFKPGGAGPTPKGSGKTGNQQKDAELDSEKRFQSEYDNIQFVAKQTRDAQKKIDDQKQLTDEEAQLAAMGAIDVSAEQAKTDNQRIQSGVRTAISDAEAEAKVNTLNFVAQQSEIFAGLLGKHTLAGKVMAIASATINTYLAASKALSDDYTAYGPAAPFVRVATVVSTILLGLKQVSEIVKVKVPGASGSGSAPSMASVSAPLAVQRPGNQTTQLDQQSLNAIGSATTRAFVLDADIQNNRERITRINRQARIG